MEQVELEMTEVTNAKKKKRSKSKSKAEEKVEKHYETKPRDIVAHIEEKADESDNDNAELTAVPSLDNEIQNLLKNDKHPFNEKLSLITDSELQQLKSKLDNEVFVTNQLQILSNAFDQVNYLIQDFPYFEMKNQAVTKAFPTLVDKEEFKTLLFANVFSDLERRVVIERLEHAGPSQQ